MVELLQAEKHDEVIDHRGEVNLKLRDTLGTLVMGSLYFIDGPFDKRLAVQVAGPREADETFYLIHGAPGYRINPAISISYLFENNIRLITYSRPGYDFSEQNKGRTVASTAAEIDCIANNLGYPPKYVLGRSGGASHALACAALLESVEKVAVAVPLAPMHAFGESWYEGMTSFNREVFSAASMGETDKVTYQLSTARKQMLTHTPGEYNPELVRQGLAGTFEMRTHREALRFSVAGWVDDTFAAVNEWGFDVATDAFHSVDTYLWIAGKDAFSPTSHGLWLADHIPNAQAYVEEDAKHSGALEVLPEMINWCLTA